MEELFLGDFVVGNALVGGYAQNVHSIGEVLDGDVVGIAGNTNSLTLQVVDFNALDVGFGVDVQHICSGVRVDSGVGEVGFVNTNRQVGNLQGLGIEDGAVVDVAAVVVNEGNKSQVLGNPSGIKRIGISFGVGGS